MHRKLRLSILVSALLISVVAKAGALEDGLLAGASARLDDKGVELAIKRGAKVDQKLPHPDAPSVIRTPVQFALTALISKSDAESVTKADRILRTLFKAGAKLTGDRDEMFSAVQGGHAKILSLLLDNGANPHARINGYTPAELAIKYGQIKLLPAIYARGVPKVDEQTTAQIQLVEAAAKQNRLHMRLAVAAGAVINDPDPAGRLAIVEVFSMPLLEPDGYAAVRYLLESEVDPKPAELSENRSTALHNLIKRNSFRDEDHFTTATIAEMLLQKGAVVSAEDSLGRTPLHYAAQYGNVAAMKVLLIRGAKVMARDAFRKTPLDMAESGEAINILKESGARE